MENFHGTESVNTLSSLQPTGTWLLTWKQFLRIHLLTMAVTHSFGCCVQWIWCGNITTAGAFFLVFMLCRCSAHKLSICSLVGFNGSRLLCFIVGSGYSFNIWRWEFFIYTFILLVMCHYSNESQLDLFCVMSFGALHGLLHLHKLETPLWS